MLKGLRLAFAGLALVAALGLAPGRAVAVGFEDSLDDCAYPKIFDALVMRPIGFAALVVSATSLVPLAFTTLWPATVNRDSGTFVYDMVVPVAKFTFARRLGQCNQVAGGY